MKTNFRYDKIRQEQLEDIICNDCKGYLGTENTYGGEIHAKYKGLNYGEHICSRCRKTRNSAYDSWIMQRDMFNLG